MSLSLDLSRKNLNVILTCEVSKCISWIPWNEIKTSQIIFNILCQKLSLKMVNFGASSSLSSHFFLKFYRNLHLGLKKTLQWKHCWNCNNFVEWFCSDKALITLTKCVSSSPHSHRVSNIVNSSPVYLSASELPSIFLLASALTLARSFLPNIWISFNPSPHFCCWRCQYSCRS